MNPAEIKLEDFERTVQRGCNKHMITKSRPIKISDNKNTLRSKIKILTSKQCSLLINGKLHKKHRIQSGLYLAQEDNGLYIACDYSIPERCLQIYGLSGDFIYSQDNGEGFVEEFNNPLDAVDYLLGVSLEILRGE